MGIASPLSRKALLPVAMLGMSGLLLAGCGAAPEEAADGTASASDAPAVGTDNSDYTGCIVSDQGGFDDRSFNQSSHDGLMAAEEEFGISTNEAESTSPSDFTPNITSMLQANCDMIIGVGFLLGDTMKPIANDNPETHFMGVDVTDPEFPDNVKRLIYDTAQGSFMAGYLAAGTSETGKVATYGGAEIPTVTIFMDGFAAGVEYYNEQKDAEVEVLGWNREAKTGSFTGDFENQAAGKTNTTNFINEGADIIMPVAGPVGLGTLDAVTEANAGGKEAKVIWVDSDGYETTDQGEVILTSVVKLMGQAVQDVIEADLADEFDGEPYVGTLENGGVALAPFHDFDAEVSDEMKAELEEIKAGIIDGSIEVNSDYSPEV
ncbi:BMP family ABC transporter substrate-binding protein [Citricoccus zhacaiensis]|uniref:BMP family ABC transporter substrate-binding protein n=1 Tax=Citricoccus zhacaiensis TaxID=489142 RepID=A0ABQ2LPP9_9MICC|nr:BMP family ABC transporter substrate-binding protein [Citricoccus zhacaiensis]GGO41517.1 BMP family ABC transporter substrate-binding protein [Citricoccus zhacaiensis]